MTTTTKAESAALEMPAFTTSDALAVLWNSATLKPHELEWFARGAERAVSSESNSLSEMLMNIGCLILSDGDGTGSFTDAGSASNLMFNLSHQLDTINGLADIARDANASVRKALRGQP